MKISPDDYLAKPNTAVNLKKLPTIVGSYYFQAMDAAGKEGAIKRVMSGLNPQRCQVFRFEHPSPTDLEGEIPFDRGLGESSA